MESDPTRMCALLVGLPDVTVVGVGDWPHWLRIVIATQPARPACSCGTPAHRHGIREVMLVDLPCFGRPTRLVWRKQRWRCPRCRRSWTGQDPTIASSRCAMTTRAARWATVQVGRHGRAVSEVADDLGCDWHTVMDAVVVFGEALINDPARFTRSTLSGWTRRSTCAMASTGASCGRRRSLMCNADSYSTSWPAVMSAGVAPGSLPGRKRGATRCAGRRWICRTRIAPCSTRCSRSRSRSLIRSMSCGWRTPRSTSAGDGCRTTSLVTAAARTIRSTGPADGSRWPPNG